MSKLIKSMKKYYFGILSMFLLLPGMALAATGLDNFNVNALNNISTYSTRNIYSTVSGIINIVLGFLGTIGVLLFLFGGFKWMTSQGDSKQIDDAKMMMGAAVVGVAIVFVSYAVANFFIGSLYNNTISGG